MNRRGEKRILDRQKERTQRLSVPGITMPTYGNIAPSSLYPKSFTQRWVWDMAGMCGHVLGRPLVGKPQWLPRVTERLFTAREHTCHGASLGSRRSECFACSQRLEGLGLVACFRRLLGIGRFAGIRFHCMREVSTSTYVACVCMSMSTRINKEAFFWLSLLHLLSCNLLYSI